MGDEGVCKCISCQLLENSLVIFEWVIESFLRKMYNFIRFVNLLYTLNAFNISHLAFEELTLPRYKQV